MSSSSGARENPIYARNVVESLWPIERVRKSVLALLAHSVRLAHSYGSAAWELSLFDRYIRLNVGQIAVLDLYSDSLSYYIKQPFPNTLPKGIEVVKDWIGYAAVPVATAVFQIKPESVDLIPRPVSKTHQDLIAEAAIRKRVSPWKTAHSPGLLVYTAQVLGESLPHPSYATPPQDLPKQLEQMVVASGGGFGDSVGNRKVEASAIKVVTDWYSSQGWSVTSVEAQNRGFDLLCQKGRVARHVEVKGLSGFGNQFVLTANEFETAFQDESFFLALVRNAISKQPELQQWSAKQFRQSFGFSPIQYLARLQDATDDQGLG